MNPITTLRFESGAVLALSLATYIHLGGPAWPWLLFLAPDLSILTYRFGPRTGAVFYNLAHTTFVPVLLGALGLFLHSEALELAAMIWMAHIGMDRLLGFGLKYPSAFNHTHLSLPAAA